MDISEVHHTAIISSNLDECKKFYIEKLGFTLLSEKVRKEKNDVLLMLQLKNLKLEIFIKTDAPERLSFPEALGLRHLAFKVDDINAAVKELNEKGIETEPVRIDPEDGKPFTFFSDPDGLPLELHE